MGHKCLWLVADTTGRLLKKRGGGASCNGSDLNDIFHR